jgi:glycosyltransferase involved in cell wall biosynthesis
MPKISVVMPYYNEAKSLKKTFELLEAQTLKPAEIVFVDSGSSDNSRSMIDSWAQKYSGNGVLVKNVPAMTGVPSSSKNVGVDHSTSDYVAFMDCGILFPTTWLEEQAKYLEEEKLSVVSGYGIFRGEGLLDRCAIAQTYGYLRPRPTVPTTVVYRQTFEESGRFLENRRAGYDVDWVDQLRVRNIPRGLNSKVTIQYNGLNYARSLSHLFSKVRMYAAPCVGMSKYYYPYYYLVIAALALVTLLLDGALFSKFFFAYLVVRGYLVPIVKSKNLRLFVEEPLAVLFLPIVGLTIDLAKIVGYVEGLTKYGVVSNDQ